MRDGYIEEFVRTWSDNRNVQIDLAQPLYAAGRRGIRRRSCGRDDRVRVVDDAARAARAFPKLQMPRQLLDAYLEPPASPDDCIFAQTTDCVSADLQTRITPCQFGGTPDCANCGCMASAGLAAVGRHRLGGFVPIDALFAGSLRIGRTIAGGAIERGLNARADVLVAEALVKLRLAHRAGRLRRRAADHQRPPLRAQVRRQLFDRAQAGAVDRGHVAQPQDDDRRQRVGLRRRCRAACRSLRTGTARGCGRSRRSPESTLSCRMCGRPASMYSGVTRDTVVVRLTRRMNSSAAITMPTSTATVRSASTVSSERHQPDQDVGVGLLPDLARSRATRPCSRRRRTGSRPAPAAARRRRSGAPNSSTPSSVSAWIIPATGERAPERMLVAVRASAPVAGKPPNSGETMLATPCANSSVFGIVAIAAHAIGDHRRQQRFDRAEHRDRERRREQRQDQLRAGTSGTWKCGSPDGNAAEARSDRRDVESEQRSPRAVPANSATM